MRVIGWTISSSANRTIHFCSILLIGDGDYREVEASAHKARLQIVYFLISTSPLLAVIY